MRGLDNLYGYYVEIRLTFPRPLSLRCLFLLLSHCFLLRGETSRWGFIVVRRHLTSLVF